MLRKLKIKLLRYVHKPSRARVNRLLIEDRQRMLWRRILSKGDW